ncbi:MAG TPA: CU044_2847 family protein [Trebonia sp.]|nr:CU044_2847 family protein [Trebonia sp.]
MSQLLPVQLPNGDLIWARVQSASAVRDTASTGPGDALVAEGFSKTIKAVAESVRMGLAHAKPSEVRVEFGLELTAKTGKVLSVLAEAGSTATIKVELAWTEGDDQAAPAPGPAQPQP